MSYETIEYEPGELAPPESLLPLIREADAQWETFFGKRINDRRYPSYVPSEPAQVHAALRYVMDKGLLRGDRFVEWGSGFGVATCMAACLGLEATGIEIEDDLVDEARKLAEEHGIEVEFIATSYVPEGYLQYSGIGGEALIEDNSFGHEIGSAPSYPEMDFPTEDIDCFFAYPWPTEQELILELFDRLAGRGSVLITCYGPGDLCLYRKL